MEEERTRKQYENHENLQTQQASVNLEKECEIMKYHF